jgi:uncharacterized integral membrane protein (TIGR00698 family)
LNESNRSPLLTSEDWWAVWFGFLIILAALLGAVHQVPKIGKWTGNPLEAFLILKEGVVQGSIVLPLVGLWLALGLLTAIGMRFMCGKSLTYLAGYTVVFVLAVIAYTLSQQVQVRTYGLEYAFWGLLIGMLISNTVTVPKWLIAGACTEMFIKTGLVLLGAEILFAKILKLGPPGLLVGWTVPPIAVLFMFFYGVKVLKIASKSLVMVIAAATSVCGVSAAIATAAACRAKKEELTLAVGMSLIFTVLMMVGMPFFIRAVGLDTIVGAAWMGGTIDSTGAVVAAGAMLGPDAEKVAAVVKMIQNVLIGFLAFIIAVYWVTSVERVQGGPRPRVSEIWNRMPKFIASRTSHPVPSCASLANPVCRGCEGARTWLREL